MTDSIYSHRLLIADGPEIEDWFVRKARILAPFFKVRGIEAEELLKCATDPAAIQAYFLSLEVVRHVVEAEVDTSTGSRSRLGLPATTVEPRLGGYFQEELSNLDSAAAVASGAERCIASAFATLAIDPRRHPEEWTGEFRGPERRLEIVTELLEEFPTGLLEEVTTAGQEDRDQLMSYASEAGLFGGLLSFRKKAVVNANSWALMRVGAMLWEASI